MRPLATPAATLDLVSIRLVHTSESLRASAQQTLARRSTWRQLPDDLANRGDLGSGLRELTANRPQLSLEARWQDRQYQQRRPQVSQNRPADPHSLR